MAIVFNSKFNFIQVSVEGNIGSGKSTLMKYFQGSESCETVPEPIAKWTNLNGHNALVSRRGIFFTINIFRLWVEIVVCDLFFVSVPYANTGTQNKCKLEE